MNSRIIVFLVSLMVPFLLPGYIRAQAKQSVQGKTVDIATGNAVAHTEIKLLYHGDTIARTHTNDTGNFFFAVQPETDTFFIETDHPRYLISRQAFLMNNSQMIDAGIIYLTPESRLLKEVVIRSKPAWEKDTVKFTADSFPVRKYATAAELLQLIPGIEITAGGNVLYNNVLVSTVSIDGMPLLNFDQGQLLQLLRGRDIDQLRIFTDNTRRRNMQGPDAPKQLDIVLKEEARHGYVGKALVGAGTSDNTAAWTTNTNVSSFTRQQKIIAFVRGGNRGETDAPPGTDLSAPQTQRGIPSAIEAGIYYDKSFLKDDKLSLSINATVKNSAENVSARTNTTYFLPDSVLQSHEQAKTTASTKSGNIGITARYNFEPGTYFEASLNAGIGFSVSGITDDVVSGMQNNIVSRSLNNTQTKGTSLLSFLNLTYNKAFRKPGRTLMITVSPNYTERDDKSDQHTSFDDLNTAVVQETDQRKLDNKNDQSILVSVNYTEPLTKKASLNVSVQSGYTTSTADNRTYDHFAAADQSIMDTLNPLYSNDYKLNNYVSKVAASLNGKIGKATANVGLELDRIAMRQTNLGTATANSKVFTDVLPFLQIARNIRKIGYLSFQYRLNAAQPGMEQLQPLINNNVPLHQLIGNPDLQQSMTHNFIWSLVKNNSNQTKASNFSISMQFTNNAIVLRQNINAAGEEISRYYNQDGNSAVNFSYTQDRTLSRRLRLSLNGKYALLKTSGYVNDALNTSLTHQFSGGYMFRYTLDTQLTINGGMSLNYSLNRFSLGQQATNHMLGSLGMLNVVYALPFGMMLTSSLNWQYMSGTNMDKTDILLWNAGIEKYLTRDGGVTIRLFAYDLLNKNKGYLSVSENNTITQTSFNTLSRYIMLNFTWNFTRR